MGIIAGAFSRCRDVPLPAGLDETLRLSISRRAGDPRQTWFAPGVALVYCDVNPSGEPPCVREGSRAVTAVAGDILFRASDGDDPDEANRNDVHRLHCSLRRGDPAILTEATGQFAAFHYDATQHALTLITDKLGQGAVYYWLGDKIAVFASSLRILEALDVVPKVMDVPSVFQLASCEFIIGTRTPYAGIRLLGSGEVLRVERRTSAICRYWRWDRIATSKAPPNELADEVTTALRRAVARRMGRDKTSMAILSGGMDTRLVACELLRRGVRLHTLNGAFPGHQDQIYARLFAKAVGTRHQEMPRLHADPQYPSQMAQRWYTSGEFAEMPPERPHLVWMGIGGCVGMGGVGLDAHMLAMLRSGRMRDGVRHFMQQESIRIPERVLTRSTRERLSNLVEESILAEYRSHDIEDPGRLPWLFMVLNEERRAYVAITEGVDLHRLEPQVPLCDSDVLAVLARVPVDVLLRHEFYMRVIERTDPRFFAAPWQTYVGHVTCAVPAVHGIPTQWDRATLAARRAHRRRTLLRQVLSEVAASDFANPVFGRAKAAAALGLVTLGLRDTYPTLEMVKTVQHFFRASGGRIAWACLLAAVLGFA